MTQISDPKHLKRWLLQTGRTWVVLNTGDLVDALSWPDGVNKFIEVLTEYREYRRGIGVGEKPCPKCKDGYGREGLCDICRGKGQIPESFKDEVPSVAELRELINWAEAQIEASK